MAAQHPWTALLAPGICTLVWSYLFAQVGVWQSGVGFMGLVILALLVLVKREDGRSDGFRGHTGRLASALFSLFSCHEEQPFS